MSDTAAYQHTEQLLVEQDDTGLTLTVHTPPCKPDPFAMLLFFLGIGMALAGGLVVANGNWGGLLLLLTGLGLAGILYRGRTMQMRGTVDRYHLTATGEEVIFSHNESPPQVFCRSKIGRIWITHHTTNGVTTGYDLTLYHDGLEQYLCNISNVVKTLGSADELLDRIVTYLNHPYEEALPVVSADENSTTAHDVAVPAVDEPILSGYRRDYATGTPVAARDNRVLCSLEKRLRYSLGLALLLLLCCFLPYHPAIAWIAPFYDYSLMGLVVMVVLFWFIGPLAYAVALSFCGACMCRMKGNGWLGMPLLAALSAWLLQSAVKYAERQFAVPIPDIVAIVAMTALMTWIFFRAISGCSCGSHPERG